MRVGRRGRADGVCVCVLWAQEDEEGGGQRGSVMVPRRGRDVRRVSGCNTECRCETFGMGQVCGEECQETPNTPQVDSSRAGGSQGKWRALAPCSLPFSLEEAAGGSGQKEALVLHEIMHKLAYLIFTAFK